MRLVGPGSPPADSSPRAPSRPGQGRAACSPFGGARRAEDLPWAHTVPDIALTRTSRRSWRPICWPGSPTRHGRAPRAGARIEPSRPVGTALPAPVPVRRPALPRAPGRSRAGAAPPPALITADTTHGAARRPTDTRATRRRRRHRRQTRSARRARHRPRVLVIAHGEDPARHSPSDPRPTPARPFLLDDAPPTSAHRSPATPPRQAFPPPLGRVVTGSPRSAARRCTPPCPSR